MKIDVDVERLLREEVSIFDIFSRIELIPLDETYPTSNVVYIGFSDLAWNGEFFYELDSKTLSINMYDRSGDVVVHTDKEGRGPGEFTMAC